MLFWNFFKVKLLDEEILNLFVVDARGVVSLNGNHSKKDDELMEKQARLALLFENLALVRVLVRVINLAESLICNHVFVLFVRHWGEYLLAHHFVKTFNVLLIWNQVLHPAHLEECADDHLELFLFNFLPFLDLNR